MSETGETAAAAQRAAPQSEWVAVLAAVTGSICVGTVPLMVRSLQTSGIDTVSLLLFRYVFGVLFLLPLAIWQRRSIGPAAGGAALGLFFCGFFSSAQTFAYYKAIETVATSIVATVFFAYPIFTLILDRFVLRISVPRSTVIAVLIIVLGVALTSLPQLGAGRADTVGLLFAMATPVLYAGYITVSYGFTRRLPAFVAACCLYGGQLASFSISAGILGLKLPTAASEWMAVLAIGTIGGAIQIAAFAYALPRLSGSGYAVIVSLELVTVILIGVAVIGERLSLAQIVGVTMVLAGVLLDRLLRAWTRRTTPIRR